MPEEFVFAPPPLSKEGREYLENLIERQNNGLDLEDIFHEICNCVMMLDIGIQMDDIDRIADHFGLTEALDEAIGYSFSPD